MRKITILLTLFCAGPHSFSAAQSPPGTLSLAPDTVEISMMYSGDQIEVRGPATADSQVVLVVRGPDKEETFNKKVRAGPIWISSGKVHVSGVPSLFLSYSSEPVRTILPDAVVEENLLDAAAIKHRMHLDAGGDEIDEELMQENYLTLKTEGDIYQVHNETEELAAGSEGFSLTIPWPRKAPPATYEVAAYECRDGEIVNSSQAELTVVKVGVPAKLFDFAMNEAAKYGALAVLFAMLAGFGIDFLVARIFGGKRSAAH